MRADACARHIKQHPGQSREGPETHLRSGSPCLCTGSCWRSGGWATGGRKGRGSSWKIPPLQCIVSDATHGKGGNKVKHKMVVEVVWRWSWRRPLTGWMVGEYGASLIGLSVLKSDGGAWKNKRWENTMNSSSDFHSTTCINHDNTDWLVLGRILVNPTNKQAVL